MHADRVPHDNVSVSDRPVGRSPLGQAHSRLAQGRVITGGMAFRISMRRHPEVVIDEPGSPSRVVVFRQERVGIPAGHYLKARGIAGGVAPVVAKDPPQSGTLKVDIESRFMLAGRDVLLPDPQAAPGVVGG